MSVKRSSAGRGSATLGGGEVGGKINRQDLHDELVKRGDSVFTPVDIALATGAGEPQVARALLGLAAEGVLEKAEPGKYRATGVEALSDADFQRVFSRAAKVDGTRLRDLQDIDRLTRNNDTMRVRLLKAQAERDHYLSVLQARGIDPGPVPVNEALDRAEARAARHSDPPAPPARAAVSDADESGEAEAESMAPAVGSGS